MGCHGRGTNAGPEVDPAQDLPRLARLQYPEILPRRHVQSPLSDQGRAPRLRAGLVYPMAPARLRIETVQPVAHSSVRFGARHSLDHGNSERLIEQLLVPARPAQNTFSA